MTSNLRAVLLIGSGSAFGGVGRHFVGEWLGKIVQSPYRTFVVNMTGALLLGFFLQWAEQQDVGHPSLRLFVAVGLCGGYTTFSTFSYETLALITTGAYGRAAVYAVASVLVSLAAVFAGSAIARLFA